MMPYRAYIEGPVRRDVALRIRQQFSTRVSVHRLSLFVYAGGESILPGRGRWRTGDMHRYPSIYAPSGIIRAHISMQMSRYARPTPGIRLQWHHRGAYLLWNHQRLPMWRSDVVHQILHSASGSVQDDRKPAPFRMTESQLRSGRQRTGCSYGDKGGDSSMMTRNVIPCGSEESDNYLYPSPPAAYGPRTRYFRISLNINVLQKSVVRGPHFFEGTANKVVLYCVVFQWITKS